MTVAVKVAEKFAEAMNKKFPATEFTGSYGVVPGRKYDKIFMGRNGSRSVHAFVERATGKLFKAASWKVPAKNARYDLSTPEGFETTVALADQYGYYLYQR